MIEQPEISSRCCVWRFIAASLAVVAAAACEPGQLVGPSDTAPRGTQMQRNGFRLASEAPVQLVYEAPAHTVGTATVAGKTYSVINSPSRLKTTLKGFARLPMASVSVQIARAREGIGRTKRLSVQGPM